MKEKIDSTARLHDIESLTFELILQICYTGNSLVNEENVLSVWQAANRLQIPFLVELCEQFTVSILSIKNYADIYRVAKVLDSKSVLKSVTNFVLKHFMTVKDDSCFLELSAHELQELIENDDQEVTSEDDVLLSILKWVDSTSYNTSGVKNENDTVNHNAGLIPMSENKNLIVDKVSSEIPPKLENKVISDKDLLGWQKQSQDRSVHLQCLLKSSRLCLASPQCLQIVYNHRLTQNDEGSKRVIFDAILYHMKGYHHGYFPPQALYRNSSDFEHVGVIATDVGSFQALSLAHNKWYPLPECKRIKNNIKIALFDNNVYAVGQADDFPSKVCVLKESSWETIVDLSGTSYLLLSHRSYLYVFNSENGKLYRMNPKNIDKTFKTLGHKAGFKSVEFALCYKEYIIVFSNDEDAGKEETCVYVMNSVNETWHRQDNLDGPAKKMASFQDGDTVYLLQRNGNVWSLSSDDVQIIAFKFVKKIWDAREHLRGALLFKGTLFLYGKLPWANPKEKLLSSLPGVYKSFHRWAKDGYASNFICTVMHNLE